jgi:cytochrome P450
MWRDYLGFVTSLKRNYGDISYANVLGNHAYDLHSPDLVCETLIDNSKNLIRWRRIADVFRLIVGNSVVVTDGETWRQQRRMLMPAFTASRVARYAELMRQAAASILNEIVPKNGESDEVDMDEFFLHLTMDIILRTLFSHVANEKETRAVGSALRTLFKAATFETFFPFIKGPDWLPLVGNSSKRKALNTLQSLICQNINARCTNTLDEVPDDILQQLLNLRDEDSGVALSKVEIFDQCMVMFQAGHETTATALLWWSWLVASDKRVAERLREELNTVLGSRDPTLEDLPSLVWLGASLKEAMRLYPPVAVLITRETDVPIEIGSWSVPAGSLIRISPWVLHRDARWYPSPEEFRPERFLPGSPKIPRGAWLPFGCGPRVCIGQHFATVEMTLVAAMLLQRYQLQLPNDALPCIPKMDVMMRPRHKLKLLLKPVQHTAPGPMPNGFSTV